MKTRAKKLALFWYSAKIEQSRREVAVFLKLEIKKIVNMISKLNLKFYKKILYIICEYFFLY